MDRNKGITTNKKDNSAFKKDSGIEVTSKTNPKKEKVR
jgi:hypothetical protein